MSDIPIELQRELCAEFRGWAISTSPPRYDGSPCTPYYSDDNKNDYGYVRDYRPDENVQQADALWDAVKAKGWKTSIDGDARISICKLWRKRIAGSQMYECEAKTWMLALTEAVACLVSDGKGGG